jgi:organic hydroperoxide reductase OsmC/OhrA
MHEYTAQVTWHRGDQPFLDDRYSRKHSIRFDGGVEIAASASPQVVRAPMSDAAAVDPEELFVASLSSCHMLWFLAIAAARKFRIDTYTDTAVGIMAKDGQGRVSITQVTLRPVVAFSGEHMPSREEFANMHHLAHEECFIANSVRTEVQCEAEFAASYGGA